MMSVPRPAMLVATVTAPSRPARATIVASRSMWRALSTLWGIPRSLRTSESCSDFSTLTVPISTGCPRLCRSATLSATASSLARLVRNILSLRSIRCGGLRSGICTTARP